MRLAAVVGLVVEEMIERRRQRLLDLLRPHDGPVAERAGEVGLGQFLDIAADPLVLGAAGGAQRREVVIKDGVQALRHLALAGEACHPDAVADQQVVEGAVQRLEEGAAVGPVGGLAHLRRRVIEPFVAPGVVAGEHPIARCHFRPLKPSRYPQPAAHSRRLAGPKSPRYKPRGRGVPIKPGYLSDQAQ